MSSLPVSFDWDEEKLNFRVRQIIVGDVQLGRHPAQGSVPAELGHLDFVGAKCSVSLVEQPGGPLKMLVDCGSPFEGEELLRALQANGIKRPEQITHLAITHWHSDHCGQIGLFPNAKLISPERVSEGQTGEDLALPEGIELATYSGHSSADLVVRIRQKLAGITRNVAIVGDLFEMEGDWAGEECWKSIALWPDRQALARQLCWRGADWIVPGHGPAFCTSNAAELPLQSPIFGKITFESDASAIIRQGKRGNGEIARVDELFSFSHGLDLLRVHLVRTQHSNILVNTGGLGQTELLLAALHSKGLSPGQITNLVITRPGESFCANLGLFQQCSLYLCHDIAIPGPFYATMDHHFIPLEGGIVSIWRDLRVDSPDQCTLAVLIASGGGNGGQKFVLIGEEIDEFLLATLELGGEEVGLIKSLERRQQQSTR